MRIAIVGAGALGLFYGAMLQRAGNDVHYLLRRDYEAIKARGLQVFSVNGDFHLEKVQGYRNPSEIGEVDLVVVGLKTFANHKYSELISPLVGKTTKILTLQNGLGNEDALAALFGADRIIGGVAFVCANRGEPGVVCHLGEGHIIIGHYNSTEISRVEQIAKLFQNAGIRCRAVAELKKARWEKLVWNIPFNGICALMMRPVDALLRHDGVRKLIIDIMHEVIDAGNAQGIREKIPASYADQLITFSEGLGPYKPSMMIDRLEQRQLELEAIFKIPLRDASRQGVPMPKVEAVHALLDLNEPANTL